MQPQHDPRSRRDTLEPTEARQASPRKMNLRVLIGSMALAVVVGVILVTGFWRATPPRQDASSGGNPSQNTQQTTTPSPATTPEAPAPTAPPSQNQTTP